MTQDAARQDPLNAIPDDEPHAFEGIVYGTPDRPCTRCGLADRHPVHRVVAPPRRSGCLSVLPWLALILVWVLW